MSDTPRTDAALWSTETGDYTSETVVDVDFARELERENAKLRAELGKLNGEWATLMSDVHDYFAGEKADRSRGRVTLLLTLLGSLRSQRDDARAELEAARGLAIAGKIDGGDCKAGWLMVRVNVSPDGFRIGQKVRVMLPQPESVAAEGKLADLARSQVPTPTEVSAAISRNFKDLTAERKS